MLWQLLTELSRVCVITGLLRYTRITVYELMRETGAGVCVCVTAYVSYLLLDEQDVQNIQTQTFYTQTTVFFVFEKPNGKHVLVTLLVPIKPTLISH